MSTINEDKELKNDAKEESAGYVSKDHSLDKNGKQQPTKIIAEIFEYPGTLLVVSPNSVCKRMHRMGA